MEVPQTDFRKLGIYKVAALVGYHVDHPVRNYSTFRALGKSFLAEYETTEARKLPPTVSMETSMVGSRARACSHEFLETHGLQMFKAGEENSGDIPVWPRDEQFLEILVANFLQHLAFRNYQDALRKSAARSSQNAKESFDDRHSQSDADSEHENSKELESNGLKHFDTNSCMRYIQGLNPANEEPMRYFEESWLDPQMDLSGTPDKRLQRYMHENNVYFPLDSNCPSMTEIANKIFEGIIFPNHPILLERINQCIEEHTASFEERSYLNKDSSTPQKTDQFDNLWVCREELWNEKRQRRERQDVFPEDFTPLKRYRTRKSDISTRDTYHSKESRHSLSPPEVGTSTASLRGGTLTLHESTPADAHDFNESSAVEATDIRTPLLNSSLSSTFQSVQPAELKSRSSLVLKFKLPSSQIERHGEQRSDDGDLTMASNRNINPPEAYNIQNSSPQKSSSDGCSDDPFGRMKTTWSHFCTYPQQLHWKMWTIGNVIEPISTDGKLRSKSVRLEGSRWLFVTSDQIKEILVEDVYCERVIQEWRAHATLTRAEFLDWFSKRFTGATKVQLGKLLQEISSGRYLLPAVSAAQCFAEHLGHNPRSELTTASREDFQSNSHITPSVTNTEANSPATLPMDSGPVFDKPSQNLEANEIPKSPLLKSSDIDMGHLKTMPILSYEDISMLSRAGTIEDPISLISSDDAHDQAAFLDEQSDPVPLTSDWAATESYIQPLSECKAFEDAAYFELANNVGPKEESDHPSQLVHLRPTSPTSQQPIASTPSNRDSDTSMASPHIKDFVDINNPVSPSGDVNPTLSKLACRRCISLKANCINNGNSSACNACTKSQKRCTYPEANPGTTPEPTIQHSITNSFQAISSIPTPETTSDQDSASASGVPSQNRMETFLAETNLGEHDTTYRRDKNDLIDPRHSLDRTMLASSSSTEIVVASAKKEPKLTFFIENPDNSLDRDFPILFKQLSVLSVHSVFELIAKRTGLSLSAIQFEFEGFGQKNKNVELHRYSTSEVQWNDWKYVLKRAFARGKSRFPDQMDFVIRILTSWGTDDGFEED